MSKFSRVLIAIVVSLGMLLVMICIYPPARRALQQWLVQPYQREILASTEGDLLNNGSIVKVIKYKGPETIFIEVTDLTPEAKLLGRIVLPDRRDGLFNLRGRVTKLAIADIQGNGQKVLLAPTFDDQLVPHLNIYYYNPSLKRFEAMKPE